MFWIITALLGLAFLFSYWGWKWETHKERPPLTTFPLVSVIIPTYKSAHVGEAVSSAKELDYPNKEIIVVDDADEFEDRSVKVIRNSARQGKARALNQAVASARGSILFFLDADTVASPSTLKKLVPWFCPGVAAVSPKFIVKNKENLLTRLISLEHSFVSALFKIHMYFGSLISFRGCGIAIRKDVLLKLGGWRETLIEDTDLAASMVSHGYKILYEPEAVVRTREPVSWGSFKRQRLRWGKGTGFSFFHHRSSYVKTPQFSLYIFPYMLLFLAIVGFFLYQTSLALLPIASLYLIYTFSLKEFVSIAVIFIFPLVANLFTSVTAASITHMAIVTSSEQNDLKDIALIIPYVFFYFPVTMVLYFRGIVSAALDKRRGRGEMDFTHW